MQIDKKLKDFAAKYAAEHGYRTLHVNDKGELFTQENLALNSVGHDKKRIATLTFQEQAASESNDQGDQANQEEAGANEGAAPENTGDQTGTTGKAAGAPSKASPAKTASKA